MQIFRLGFVLDADYTQTVSAGGYQVTVSSKCNFCDIYRQNCNQWRNQDFVSRVAVSVYGRTFRISRHCHCTESLSHWPTTKRTVKLKIAQFLESYFVL